MIIHPLDYGTVLNRAKTRMLKLYDRVRGAPFLQKNRAELDTFLAGVEKRTGVIPQGRMDFDASPPQAS